MMSVLVSLLPTVRSCVRSRAALQLEILALRHQLQVLNRSRDHAFAGWTSTAKAMGIEEVLTAPRSPWQNAYVERFIGSVRRECLNHVIVFSTTGRQQLMNFYCDYYHRSRTHLSLDKDARIPRPSVPPSDGRIVAIRQVGRLHHRYERHAA